MAGKEVGALSTMETLVKASETEGSVQCDRAETSGHKRSEEETREFKEENVEVLSHREIMHVVQDTVAGLISNDPLLKDLHPYVTLEEVNSMIALEYGQAMVVNVRRGDEDVMPVLVKQEATVLDLKHGIKRFIMLRLTRRGGGPIGISWRYVWRRYWLYYNGEKLTNDNKRLKDESDNRISLSVTAMASEIEKK
ncbi:hypothetical protein BaRGS_00030114 [Batillaria attramentaria]|uniref:SNRNP25 ubiquitin-like domain-containing protein n=1 Tax=Batillaria attramentaria TaxID=370345 RepID=A0ABD0JV11_9CAEN